MTTITNEVANKAKGTPNLNLTFEATPSIIGAMLKMCFSFDITYTKYVIVNSKECVCVCTSSRFSFFLSFLLADFVLGFVSKTGS